MDFRFRRIAIINRGEPAMRLIRAVRDLKAEHGIDLRTIAFVTDPDRDALFAREADEVVPLGAALFVDPADGHRKSRYLDYACLENALRSSKADAAWVGWGFVAEHPEFAALCERLGVTFVGPSAEVMRKLGDKIASKKLAESSDFPVTPWSNGPVNTVKEALEHAKRIGFPCMLKATAGGGGRGIRKIASESDLASAFESAHAEALKAFGDGTLFLERMVTRARHVEVQVVCDAFGNGWALGVRDCSLQRRNQKVVEEGPSPALSPELDKAVREAAVRLALNAGYVNAGTVECLFEQETGEFFFMEMNTRLQVEHPVTELTTGVDIVKLQLHVANGERLAAEPPPTQGHAIEVRLNAEDPDNGFTPSPGRVDLVRFPVGPGIRVDTGLAQGDLIPSEFDSMIAKIIAHGRTRAEALGRLRRALDECAVVVRDGTTNAGFLRALLAHPDVEESRIDTGWLDRRMASSEGLGTSLPFADLALLTAAIDEAATEHTAEVRDFITSCSRGRPGTRTDFGITLDLVGAAGTCKVRVDRVGATTYRTSVDGKSYLIERHHSDPYTGAVVAEGRRHRVVTSLQGTTRLVSIDGASHRISRDSGGLVRSPAAAIVLAVVAKPGDEVDVGARLLTLEAMKMEAVITAPAKGTVREILVAPNQQVAPGTPLVALETREVEASSGALTPIAVSLTPHSASLTDYAAFLAEVEALLLGFDADANRIAAFLRLPVGPDALESEALEQRAVALFTDLVALHAHTESPEASHPSDEQMRYYLRTFDTRALNPSFATRLSRHMKRYGVTDLTRSRRLEEGLLLTHRAHARVHETIPAILHILENALRKDAVASGASGFSRESLDDLVAATQVHHPAVNNLARSLRHRTVENARISQVRAKVYEDLAKRMDSMTTAHDADAVRDIAECPYPLLGFLMARLAEPRNRTLALEVLLHHFYRERHFETQESTALAGSPALVASFALREKRVHVLLAAVDRPRLQALVRDLSEFLESKSPSDEALVDIFISETDGSDLSSLAREVAALVPSHRPGGATLARISLVSCSQGAQTDAVTIRPDANGHWQQDELTRGLHPVEAKRFELWRMSGFDVTHMPTRDDDIHLFRLVSKTNPRDERLFVFAEVRDLTPVRNELGRTVELPHFERMFGEAATSLREALMRFPPKREPGWNRIILNVIPPLTGQERDFLVLAHKLQAFVENLHLEKVVVKARVLDRAKGWVRDQVIEFSNANESGLKVAFLPPRSGPITPLSEYERRVIQMRLRRQAYAYEIIRMLTPSRTGEQSEFPAGEFLELDLSPEGDLVGVDREPGRNSANIVVGLIRNFTSRHPEGMERVLIVGDGSRDMGALAEPECRRIIAALNLAKRRRLPVEWFPVSSGARISMDSGTENLDWTARVLRHIIEHTEEGGEINIVVNGINVGAQAYWNAEATMLMHTRGILVMTPEGSMVLTGKRALDYSGGVSAEDNQGIGGFDRIMGPNGQAQYYARDLREACRILFSHYEFSYIVPGETRVRRCRTNDSVLRDVTLSPHSEAPFATVGEIFSDSTNPGRKKPFDMRAVLAATVDQDLPTLERWKSMRHGDTAIVWDAWIGGMSTCLIGIESKPLPRAGFVPGDGPDTWAGGTLFPISSKKVARAINSASGNRPIAVVANLSGFDGSPESLRKLQLEYGAEIGRAVVKCKSPIVFCVITRFHGGAYVVFSTALNDRMEVAALKGAYASVIGGTPAAAVVFPNEVRDRAHADSRVRNLQARIQEAEGRTKADLYTELNALLQKVLLEKQAEVAAEFDAIHSVERALEVGSLHRIVTPRELRSYLIEALERGLMRESRGQAGAEANPGL